MRPRRVLGPWTGTPSLIPVPLTPAPAEDATSSTQLLGELQADQDQQLAGWLATEIRAAAPDATATVLALPRIVDRNGVVVAAAPMTGRTRPIDPNEVAAALRVVQADDDRPTTMFVHEPGQEQPPAASDDDEETDAPAHHSDVRPASAARLRATQ